MIESKTPPMHLAWVVWGLGAIFYLMGFFQRVAPAVITTELRHLLSDQVASLVASLTHLFHLIPFIHLLSDQATSLVGPSYVFVFYEEICQKWSFFSLREHFSGAKTWL